jgi:peptidoglycan hydrolase CwlO-like protein
MNRILLCSLIVFLCSMSVFSQVSQETIEYNKRKHSAFKMEYTYPAEVVEKALVQRMEQLGYRNSKADKGLLNFFDRDKGIIVYKNAFVSEINEKSMDYAFKIETRKKKEKNGSAIYMVMMKDGEDAMRILNETEMEQAKSFLINLNPDVESSHLEMQIRGQEEGVSKSEKKFRSLQSDSLSIENKIRELQAQLEKLIKDQEFQQKEIENQKRLLDEMKGKRKITQ